MPLQTSGPISASQIRTEHARDSNIAFLFSEYYRETTPPDTSSNRIYRVLDLPENVNVPHDDTIRFSDFYGTIKAHIMELSGDIANADLNSLALADGWDGNLLLIVEVSPGTTLYSTSTSSGGAILSGSFPYGVIINNSGNITGYGGSAGGAGGPAIQITTTDDVEIINNSGAFIAGGGGGGGGSSGGGGAGQAAPGQPGSPGGSYTTSTGISTTLATFGCSEGCTITVTGGCTVTVTGTRGAGGNQGAYAGSGTTSGGCCSASGTGGCTGPTGAGCYGVSASATICGGGGTPNAGGQGGSILSATENVTISGGGWGLPGSGTGAGAGGPAVSGPYTSITDNGTIYGSI